MKKHPRDTADYNFDESIDVINFDKTIPAELLLTFYNINTYIFLWPSTFVFSIDSNEQNLEVLFFEQIDNEGYKEAFDKSIHVLEIDIKNIARIS